MIVQHIITNLDEAPTRLTGAVGFVKLTEVEITDDGDLIVSYEFLGWEDE